jgi:hypothetical protein
MVPRSLAAVVKVEVVQVVVVLQRKRKSTRLSWKDLPSEQWDWMQPAVLVEALCCSAAVVVFCKL